MRNDFEMVVHKAPTNCKRLNIYPIGDLHIGSKECDLEFFEKWRTEVISNSNSRVVIIGDMMDFGLKNTKTNIYEAVMSPMEQKDMLTELLRPIKDKIIGAVPGNHEYRGVREAGDCPLYDVMCRLGIENVYRPNACIIKVCLGGREKKQFNYGIMLQHGTTKTKLDRFCESVDGVNVFVSGHTHSPKHQPRAKLTVDLRHESVRTEPYQEVVVEPFVNFGGYAMRGMYLPTAPSNFQMFTLFGTEKKVSYSYT